MTGQRYGQVGVQQVSLLGPYFVNYNNPGIAAEESIELTDLEPELFVLHAWMFAPTEWINDSTGMGEFAIGVTIPPGSTTVYITDYPAGSVSVLEHADPESPTEPKRRVARTSEGSKLTFEVYADAAANWTQGVAEIYALVAGG